MCLFFIFFSWNLPFDCFSIKSYWYRLSKICLWLLASTTKTCCLWCTSYATTARVRWTWATLRLYVPLLIIVLYVYGVIFFFVVVIITHRLSTKIYSIIDFGLFQSLWDRLIWSYLHYFQNFTLILYTIITYQLWIFKKQLLLSIPIRKKKKKQF